MANEKKREAKAALWALNAGLFMGFMAPLLFHFRLIGRPAGLALAFSGIAPAAAALLKLIFFKEKI